MAWWRDGPITGLKIEIHRAQDQATLGAPSDNEFLN